MNDTPMGSIFHDPEAAAAWVSYERAVQDEVTLGLITAELGTHLCNAWGMAAWFRFYQAAHTDFKRE
ncbi:hypothetical protein [Deinococcus sp. Leaf326]|uniref:hypothetical protein n=1 Tax=Deinococcus sp. Leaf326 TaxID=1736338 RepID=UPI0006FD56E6|nr:hypothetical protein [Deinococcus sp. Leaf326]KQR04126.1 hypothetical protein ASF71_21285 [Deinococcus sp. Leaf326]